MTVLYPLLKPPSFGYHSYVTIHNFHPFPLSFGWPSRRFIYLVFSYLNVWNCVFLETLRPSNSLSLDYRDIFEYLPSSDISPFILLTTDSLNERLDSLNEIPTPSSLPAWRSTISISKGQSSTSFQGECPIFKPNRPLLSFTPFIQGSGSDNYFYLVNLTDSPVAYDSELNVYDPTHPKQLLASFPVSTNSCNPIFLDDTLSEYTSLIFHCPKITGVPIFLSTDGTNLSMEHTHPAASFTIGLDNRINISRVTALNWSNYIYN
tara:strand:- start:3857 stop:4645 length:789 start_codon:yes stop_codon:yes gene_type:complete